MSTGKGRFCLLFSPKIPRCSERKPRNCFREEEEAQRSDRDGLRSKAAKDMELAPTIGVFQPESALFSPTAVGAAGVGRLFSLLRHADLRWNQCPPAWGKDSASHGFLRSIYSEETEAQWFHRTRRAHAKSTDLSNRAGTAVHEKQRQCLLRTRRDGNEKKKAAKHRVASAKRGAIPL